MTADIQEEQLQSTHGEFLGGWNVLLWNDDVHSMDFVVSALLRTIPMDVQKAVEVMYEAHEHGKAVAWSGAKEVAELYRDGLESCGLSATIST
ncbi:MAG: ATP-dependent Clp protease adaptor ClpS [Chloroflexota bacterium]|nr:ATP-dependent Clp protease adaptor ClpS [Chloroflexota bacterium]